MKLIRKKRGKPDSAKVTAKPLVSERHQRDKTSALRTLQADATPTEAPPALSRQNPAAFTPDGVDTVQAGPLPPGFSQENLQSDQNSAASVAADDLEASASDFDATTLPTKGVSSTPHPRAGSITSTENTLIPPGSAPCVLSGTQPIAPTSRRRRRQESASKIKKSVPTTRDLGEDAWTGSISAVKRSWVRPVWVTIAAALLLGIAALLPRDVTTALVVVITMIIGLGWGRLNRVPDPNATAITVCITGMAAVAVVRFMDDLFFLALVLAFGMVVAFAAEMARSDGRDRLVQSISASVSGSAIAVAAVCWVAMGESLAWGYAVLPAGLVLVGAGLGSLISGRKWPRAFWSICAGMTTGVGVAIGLGLAGFVRPGSLILFASQSGVLSDSRVGLVLACAILGLLAGLIVSMVTLFFRGPLAPVTDFGAMAVGLLPVVAMGVPAYGLIRVLGG